MGTDLHIPGKATGATAGAVAQPASPAPSVSRPSVCRVCSAAWTFASSTAAHSLVGVKGCLHERKRETTQNSTNQQLVQILKVREQKREDV